MFRFKSRLNKLFGRKPKEQPSAPQELPPTNLEEQPAAPEESPPPIWEEQPAASQEPPQPIREGPPAAALASQRTVREEQRAAPPPSPHTSRAVESILENESLTADLDDDAAKALLDWGMACAKRITTGTTDLDRIEAQEATSLRLRATRRLMRRVNQWVPKREQMTAEEGAATVSKILEQAAIIYGGGFLAASSDRQDAFLRQVLTAPPVRAVEGLRALIEHPDDDAMITEGGGK